MRLAFDIIILINCLLGSRIACKARNYAINRSFSPRFVISFECSMSKIYCDFVFRD